MTILSPKVKANGDAFLTGGDITYADIYIVSILQYITGRLGLEPGSIDTFKNSPNFVKYQERVLNYPGIKTWIEKRPSLLY